MKKYAKTIVALVILTVTVAAFVYYVTGHPQTITRLRHLPPVTLLILLAAYTASFFAYVLVTRFSLALYGKRMGGQENILFNAYSSLVNFFLPGQSGPVFRGAYLKKKHSLGVRQYLFGTLLYYGFFAVMSVGLMAAALRPWWQTVLTIGVVGGVSIWIIKRYKRRSHLDTPAHLDAAVVTRIGLATAGQVLLQTVIFGVELHTIGVHASLGQIMAYTGVANMSLFVALTPGGIGIREAFLLFAQRLFHINSANIIAASVVDRAAYLVFLGILFVLVISLHAKDKLQVKQIVASEEK